MILLKSPYSVNFLDEPDKSKSKELTDVRAVIGISFKLELTFLSRHCCACGRFGSVYGSCKYLTVTLTLYRKKNRK